MRTISFALVTLATSAALAFPSVKDHTEYNVNYASAAGGAIDYVLKLEITGYDSAAQQYTVKSTQLLNGQEKAQDQKYAADQFPTNAQVNDLLAQCAQQGGTPEKITVPAGSFDTCALPQQNNGKVWIAAVPFGFAKLISIDQEGNTTTAELSTFTNGQ